MKAPFLILILTLMSLSSFSQNPPLGTPVLHGVYHPDGHHGRSYTFYNNGDFYCEKEDKEGHIIKGYGQWERKKGQLILNFLPIELHPKEHPWQEPAHVEVYDFLQGDSQYQEIQDFCLQPTNAPTEKFQFRRSAEHLDYILRGD